MVESWSWSWSWSWKKDLKSLRNKIKFIDYHQHIKYNFLIKINKLYPDAHPDQNSTESKNYLTQIDWLKIVWNNRNAFSRLAYSRDITLLSTLWGFVVFWYSFETSSYILPYFWYTWHFVIKGFRRCWLLIWIKFFLNGSNIADQNLNCNFKFVWNQFLISLIIN